MPDDKRLSELIQRTPNGQEFLEVIIPPFTPGTNRKVLLQDIVDMASGGGGAVDSVNGQTGVVVLDATDVGADPAGTADAKVADAINDGTTTIAPSQNAVFDALALKAPLASPAFTGTPTAPTATINTSTTQLATTQFVDQNISKVGMVLYMYNNFI